MCVCACVLVFSYFWSPQRSPTDSLPYFFCASIFIWPILLQLAACMSVCMCSANAYWIQDIMCGNIVLYVLQLCCDNNYVFCSACGFTYCLYKVLTALDIFLFLNATINSRFNLMFWLWPTEKDPWIKVFIPSKSVFCKCTFGSNYILEFVNFQIGPCQLFCKCPHCSWQHWSSPIK